MKILLAEDEKDLSRALVTALKHNNFVVDAVYNGVDAYDYLSCVEYDVVILDIMMPKMDGITVLKKVREEGNKTPIIMLTAKAEIEDRVKGLDYGADDYLTKPFAMKELIARIRAVSRRNTELISNMITIGNTTLDIKNATLSTSDGELRLSSREFQMMEMLMKSPGQLISVDHFMEKIWGYESDAEQNVVWVYVSNLRKKFVEIKSDITIKASRGLGYYLKKND